MKRYEIINWFIREHEYLTYLEIGLDNPAKCFNMIEAKLKMSVDPAVGMTKKLCHYRMTSDDFFKQNNIWFDLVFVDGLHIREQVVRDVDHSLKWLNPRGTIILHDCMPTVMKTACTTRLPRTPWYGTVWQAWADLRSTRSDLSMRVVTEDCGRGIVQRGAQELYEGPRESFNDYLDHQGELLQMISATAMKNIYRKVD
jgi:hypothetical protein